MLADAPDVALVAPLVAARIGLIPAAIMSFTVSCYTAGCGLAAGCDLAACSLAVFGAAHVAVRYDAC